MDDISNELLDACQKLIAHRDGHNTRTLPVELVHIIEDIRTAAATYLRERERERELDQPDTINAAAMFLAIHSNGTSLIRANSIKQATDYTRGMFLKYDGEMTVKVIDWSYALYLMSLGKVVENAIDSQHTPVTPVPSVPPPVPQ